MDYYKFLNYKRHSGADAGFDPVFYADKMYDFQKDIVEWATRKGRSAIFADCGLGKTVMQLCWGENVYRHTNKNVLLLTPLAVSAQTIREAEKFGVDAKRSHEGEVYRGINITNYERLHYFDPNNYDGIVLDESSILKSFDGARRNQITEFMKKIKYRLLCTATAAPNDYIELGTSSEALGNIGHIEMLNRFFVNNRNNTSFNRVYGQMVEWRLKGHAELPFWRWVCSWAKALRKPSDIGYSDEGFDLEPYIENDHYVKARKLADGMLFNLPAHGLSEQRDELKRTIAERVEKVVELQKGRNPVIIWCHLNKEGDMITDAIPDAVQVKGADRDDKKEERFLAFANNEIRVLVTKPKIGAWGMNFQNCSDIIMFPSHSYEQYYQGIRRCWRFGQKNRVTVDMVLTEGYRAVLMNLKRKADQAGKMFENLVREMNNYENIERVDKYKMGMELPEWL